MVLRFWPRFRREDNRSALWKTKLTGRERASTHQSPPLDIRADGHRLRAIAYGFGPRHAPTLVFLHEGLGCIALWRDFPNDLAEATGCNAIVYERWGYGGSEALTEPHAPDFLEREAAHALPDVLDHFGVERAVLVGHSDGGSIALLFAAAHPERTIAVITEAAHVVVEDVSIAGVRAACAAFESGHLARKLERYHGENTESMFRGWADIWLSPAFRDWSMIERLDAVRAPVLAIQGDDDGYGTPAQLELIARHCGGPVETKLIPACAHIPHDQARETVLAAMSAFVRAQASA